MAFPLSFTLAVSAELVAIPSSHSSTLCMTRNQTLQEAERTREVWRYVLTPEWLKLKKPTQKGKEDSIVSAGTRGKYTLFQAVARCAVIVESRGRELLAGVGQRKCPNRKILVFRVKDHYMIWHKCAPEWESCHSILAKVFTTNSFCTLLSHLFSCPCSSLLSLAPLAYNITSEQIHMLFVTNPATSPSSDEDIGG